MVEKLAKPDAQTDVARISIYMGEDGSVEVVVDGCSLEGSQMAWDGLLDGPAKDLVAILRDWSSRPE